MSPTSKSDGDPERFNVQSADGTSIAVWADGNGPPLVMVHGALNDHTTDRPFIDELRGTVTTFAMDRRGRGSPAVRRVRRCKNHLVWRWRQLAGLE
jgi:hypothetical protein